MAFLNSTAGSVTIALVIVVVLTWAWFRGYRRDVLKRIAYAAVIQAEKALGNGTGEFKYAYAVEFIYRYTPVILRVFITKKLLDEAIEGAVQYMKTKLSESPTLATAFTAQLPG